MLRGSRVQKPAGKSIPAAAFRLLKEGGDKKPLRKRRTRRRGEKTCPARNSAKDPASTERGSKRNYNWSTPRKRGCRNYHKRTRCATPCRKRERGPDLLKKRLIFSEGGKRRSMPAGGGIEGWISKKDEILREKGQARTF